MPLPPRLGLFRFIRVQGAESNIYLGRSDGRKEQLGHSRIHRKRTHHLTRSSAIGIRSHAAIPRRPLLLGRVVKHAHPGSAPTAPGDPLEQGRALPRGAAGAGPEPVVPERLLVLDKLIPSEVSGVHVPDAHWPVGHRPDFGPGFPGLRRTVIRVVLLLPVRIGTSVGWRAQHPHNGPEGRHLPAHLTVPRPTPDLNR
jgi:hypothetical protein